MIEPTHRRNCSYKFLGMKVMIVYSVEKLSGDSSRVDKGDVY